MRLHASCVKTDGLRCVSLDITPYHSITNTSPAIHGDKQQNERDWVLNEFKTGKSPIMVATDVASRGIGMIANPPTPPPPPLPELFLRVNCLCVLLRLSRALAAFASMTSSMA